MKTVALKRGLLAVFVPLLLVLLESAVFATASPIDANYCVCRFGALMFPSVSADSAKEAAEAINNSLNRTWDSGARVWRRGKLVPKWNPPRMIGKCRRLDGDDTKGGDVYGFEITINGDGTYSIGPETLLYSF